MFTAIFSTCVVGVIAMVGMAESGSIIGKFRDDKEVIEIGTLALRAQLTGMVIAPISVCSNMLFQSIGKSKMATFLSTLRSGLCFIPTIIIMSKLFGIIGIEVTQFIVDIMVFLVTIPFTIPFLKQLKEQGNQEVK